MRTGIDSLLKHTGIDARTLKAVFDYYCRDVVFDKKLALAVQKMTHQFTVRNEEHVQFFGGSLTGVHMPVFSVPNDERAWFEGIMGVDETEVTQSVRALTSIVHTRKISSDPFNLAVAYCAHRFFTSEHLKEEDRLEAADACLTYLYFKFICSLMHGYFKHLTTEAIAQATHNNMSQKFLLRQVSTWYDALRYHAAAMTRKDRVYPMALEFFSQDYDVVKYLNATQKRVREMLKEIYALFIRTHYSTSRVKTTSLNTIDQSGTDVLMSMHNGVDQLTDYLHACAAERSSFVKPELVEIVEDLQPTADKALVVQTLLWCTKHYLDDPRQRVHALIDATMTHCFTFINHNTSRTDHSLEELLPNLRNAYGASKTQTEDLINLRAAAEEIVKEATGKHSDRLVAAIRTALLLYLVLRAHSKNMYQ